MQDVLIAGNAPSLKNIDYTLLPQSYDVFRCNQFYFEQSYHTGKNLKAVFFNHSCFLEQYHTLKKLEKNEEYQSELIFCVLYEHHDNDEFVKNFSRFFPDARISFKILKRLKKFYAKINYADLYEDKRITMGVYMCGMAVAMGYRRLYLAGIDFYQQGSNYAFDSCKKNIAKLLPNFKKTHSKYENHSQSTDLDALKFLEKTYDVTIYCICPTSPLAQYFPLAPKNEALFTLEDRKPNAINDILLPTKSVYKKCQKLQKGLKIKDNLYYRLFYDLQKLPSHIKEYFKTRRF